MIFLGFFVCVVAVVTAAVVLGFVEGSERMYAGDLVSWATFYSLIEQVRM